MKVRFFGCGRFAWLSSESEDRPLTPKEQLFMERHRAVCRPCSSKEEASALALNMLREAKLEADEPEVSFDRRLLRRVRVESVRSGLQYWAPALFGAAIAAVALVSALQMLARSTQLPIFRADQSEARRIQLGTPEFPEVRIADRISDRP